MASFHVVSSEVATTVAHPPADGAAGQQQQQLLQHVWTISSKHQLQTLHVKVPGVVFIDYDSSLSPEVPSPVTTESPSVQEAAAPAGEKIAAKIVVTTDSRRLLELLEVVPLDAADGMKGFQMGLKNQSATLQCSVLTQVFVSGKCTLRDFDSNGPDVVFGDNVLVREDPEAGLKLVSRTAGDVFLSSTRGFSLASFCAQKLGNGSFHIRTPCLEAKNGLNLSTGGDGNATMFVAADKMRAKTIIALAVRSQRALVETRDLATEVLMIWSIQRGLVTLSGHGTASHSVSIVLGGGRISAADIVAEKVGATINWGGTVVTRATKELSTSITGPGLIEFAGDRPEIVTESSWFRWKWIFGDFVVPYSPNESTLQPYKPREQPLRQPKVVQFRVKKASFGNEPTLEIGSSSWFDLSKLTLVSGVLALVAVGVVVAAKRKQ